MSELTFANKHSVLNVNLKFVESIEQIGLNKNDSLLVIGKSKDLRKLEPSLLTSCLKDLQIPETWLKESIGFLCEKKDAKSTVSGTPGTSLSWLNKLVVHTVANTCSRNNTPSRCHLIAKIVRQNAFSENQLIVIVCERKNSIASACAVARSFPLYSQKTSEKKSTPRNVTVSFVFTDDPKNTANTPNKEETFAFNTLAQSVRLTAKIIDTPCADMTTDHFLEEVKIVCKKLNIEPLVIEGEELNKQGFGGLYNVGKAAVAPPKLVVLSHLKPSAKRTVAWVGKGIVYDTGGLCIKTKTGMCGMKVDCGVAAGILGAFYTAVSLGFEDNLHAVLCLAENAVAANALRPDDIIKLYSGKTVEITNTDAEGRLVLGDGVAYAKKDLKADIIVDMATLTGAQGAATGKYHCAVLTNSEQWEKAVVEVGKMSGDLAFPVVFAPELHFSEYNSEVADMRNSVIKADNAACACAGLFIHSHLGSDFDGIWIHLDMAYPVTDGDRATGYGVALLNSLFSSSIKNEAFRLVTSSNNELPLKSNGNESQDDD
jgi:probable aminopeptidase NPEPL1